MYFLHLYIINTSNKYNIEVLMYILLIYLIASVLTNKGIRATVRTSF